MGLKRKKAPRALDPSVTEWVWVQDEAVDLEASDLVAYCRDGGQSGLVLKDGVVPDIVRVKPLGDRAYRQILSLMGAGAAAFPDEAFRLGVVSVDGFDIRWDRQCGLRCLSDQTLDELGEYRVDLPRLVAERTCWEANGATFDDEVSEDLVETSLPQLVGYHILAETFRLRRGNA